MIKHLNVKRKWWKLCIDHPIVHLDFSDYELVRTLCKLHCSFQYVWLVSNGTSDTSCCRECFIKYCLYLKLLFWGSGLQRLFSGKHPKYLWKFSICRRPRLLNPSKYGRTGVHYLETFFCVLFGEVFFGLWQCCFTLWCSDFRVARMRTVLAECMRVWRKFMSWHWLMCCDGPSLWQQTSPSRSVWLDNGVMWPCNVPHVLCCCYHHAQECLDVLFPFLLIYVSLVCCFVLAFVVSPVVLSVVAALFCSLLCSAVLHGTQRLPKAASLSHQTCK